MTAFTGTLANFSGGDLNWTIEARCADDLILCAPTDAACAMNPPTPPPASVACVKPRTQFDNEAGSN